MLFDAWFVGYTPQYITGVWVGLDEEAPLGKGENGAPGRPVRSGSDSCKRVLENEPVEVFQPPKEGIVFAKIDADTGLLPVPESKDVIFECFKEGTVPTKFTKRPNEVREVEDLFKKDI